MLYTFKAAHIPFHHYNEYRQAQQTSMCLILKLAILNFKSGKMIGINYLEVQFFTHKYAHFIVKVLLCIKYYKYWPTTQNSSLNISSFNWKIVVWYWVNFQISCLFTNFNLHWFVIFYLLIKFFIPAINLSALILANKI